MLRNLTFAVQFAYFSIRPKKFCFFFEQLLSQKATVEQLLDKSRETFWKISSNLWKALGADQGIIAVGGRSIFLWPPCLFPNHPPLLDLMLIPTLDWVHLKPRRPPIRDFFQAQDIGSRSRRSYGKRGGCETTTTEQERINQFSLATSRCIESSRV